MTTSELPPALRPWSASLAFLTVEAALHIGPLVRRLDALVRRHDATAAREGEPDGYGGLTTRGHPERLLLSEWLLAEELPLEFMRRAAQRELLHINPVFRSAQPEGRVAVFCDVGPDQLGAARLVQLAALIVLHRRALARGTDLVLGVSGATAWHEGDLPELYTAWRRAREPSPPTAEELTARQQTLDQADELWVLAGETLAATAADTPLLLRTRETGWDADGVTAVEVRFEHRATTLAVPPGPVSVQVLRGAGVRRAGRARTEGDGLSGPIFPSQDRRLLLRGDKPEHVLVVSVPSSPTGGARPKLYRFKGPVVAATSYAGTRIVALVLHGDRLRGEVIGKKLARVDTVDVALADLGLTHDALDFDGLKPLYFDHGALLCQFGEDWWRLPEGAQRPALDEGTIAVGPGHVLDAAARARIDAGRLMLNHERTITPDVDPARLQAFAGERWVAWSQDGALWRVHGRNLTPVEIHVSAGDEVLGLIMRGDQPVLVVGRQEGTVWVLYASGVTTAVPGCNGPAMARALHSGLGVMAIQRDPVSVELVKLETSETLLEVHVG